MVLLTLLIIVHEYLASQVIPYHRLKYETAVASTRLIETLYTALVEGATCILFAERFGMLEIDETRNVSVT